MIFDGQLDMENDILLKDEEDEIYLLDPMPKLWNGRRMLLSNHGRALNMKQERMRKPIEHQMDLFFAHFKTMLSPITTFPALSYAYINRLLEACVVIRNRQIVPSPPVAPLPPLPFAFVAGPSNNDCFSHMSHCQLRFPPRKSQEGYMNNVVSQHYVHHGVTRRMIARKAVMLDGLPLVPTPVPVANINVHPPLLREQNINLQAALDRRVSKITKISPVVEVDFTITRPPPATPPRFW